MREKRSGVGNARTLKVVGTSKMAVLFPPPLGLIAMQTRPFYLAVFGTDGNGVRDLAVTDSRERRQMG